jgi:transcriptional regulator with XRE-family HTH domain
MNKRLREIRLRKGLSQENIALELKITQKAYSKIENGETSLNHDKLLKVAKVLEISPKEICPIHSKCIQTDSKSHNC